MNVVNEDLIADAIAIALHYHKGQVDKLGSPYIGHLLRVCGNVIRDGAADWVCAGAMLHDLFEDTDATAQTLRDHGITEDIIRLVDVLTHRSGEPRQAYIDRIIAFGPIAIRVKVIDIIDNMSRLPKLDHSTQTRLREKYWKDLRQLKEAQAP